MKEGRKGERNRKSAFLSMLCPMLSFPATSCVCKASNLPGTGGSPKGKLNLILGLKKFFCCGKNIPNEQLRLLRQLRNFGACPEG